MARTAWRVAHWHASRQSFPPAMAPKIAEKKNRLLKTVKLQDRQHRKKPNPALVARKECRLCCQYVDDEHFLLLLCPFFPSFSSFFFSLRGACRGALAAASMRCRNSAVMLTTLRYGLPSSSSSSPYLPNRGLQLPRGNPFPPCASGGVNAFWSSSPSPSPFIIIIIIGEGGGRGEGR